MSKVTKKRYQEVSAKYTPNKFTVWVYRNFSTLLKSKPIPYGSWIAVICFAIATIGIILFDQLGNKEMANKFVWFYLPFVLWMPLGIIAFTMNNKRNRKIANELGVSEEEFNELVAKYE